MTRAVRTVEILREVGADAALVQGWTTDRDWAKADAVYSARWLKKPSRSSERCRMIIRSILAGQEMQGVA